MRQRQRCRRGRWPLHSGPPRKTRPALGGIKYPDPVTGEPVGVDVVISSDSEVEETAPPSAAVDPRGLIPPAPFHYSRRNKDKKEDAGPFGTS